MQMSTFYDTKGTLGKGEGYGEIHHNYFSTTPRDVEQIFSFGGDSQDYLSGRRAGLAVDGKSHGKILLKRLGFGDGNSTRILLLPPKNLQPDASIRQVEKFFYKGRPTSRKGRIDFVEGQVTYKQEFGTKVFPGNLRQLNSWGWSIYYRVNYGYDTADTITHCPRLFCDFDDGNKTEQAEKIEAIAGQGLVPSEVVESKRGYHVYWNVTDLTPGNFEHYQQRLASLMGSDISLGDLPQTMRLPGFSHTQWNPERGLERFPINLVALTDHTYTAADLDKILPTLPEKARSEHRHRKASKPLQAPTSSLDKLLGMIADHRFDEYDSWFRIIAAIHHASGGSDEGLELADKHSQRSDRYEDGCVEDLWEKLDSEREKIATIATLIGLAKGDSGVTDEEIKGLLGDYRKIRQDSWRRVKKTPDIYFPDSPESRYLPRNLSERVIESGKQLVLLQANMGVGKTVNVLQPLVEHFHKLKKKVNNPTHRISLSSSLARVLGTEFLNRLEEEAGDWLSSDMLKTSLTECIDSIGKVNIADDIYLLILDEATQLFNHMWNADTCKSRRCYMLGHFQQLLKAIVARGGVIVLADANLDQIAVEFIQEVTGLGDDQTLYIKSDHPGLVRDYWVSKENSDREVLQETQLKALRDGQRQIVCCDSQEFVTDWYQHCLNRGIPAEHMILITSKTVGEESVKAYLANPDAWLQEHSGCKAVFYSPTIGSGVSFTKGGFQQGYAVFQGTFKPTDAHQMLGRYRPELNWMIWTNPRPHIQGDKTDDPDKLTESWYRKAGGVINLLELGEEIYPDLTSVRERLDKLIDAKDNLIEPNLVGAARYVAQENWQRKHYAQYFVEILREQGQRVREEAFPSPERDRKELAKERKEERKDIREKRYRAQAQAIAEQPVISDEQAEQLMRKNRSSSSRLTEAEQNSLIAYRFNRELGSQVTTEVREEAIYQLYLRDGGELRKKLRARHRLFHPIEGESKLAEDLVYRLSHSAPCLNDVWYGEYELNLYRSLGLPELIQKVEAGAELTYHCQEVKELMVRIEAQQEDCKLYLDVVLPKSSKRNMDVVKQVLSQFAVKLKSKQIRKQGKRSWVYSLDTEVSGAEYAISYLKALETLEGGGHEVSSSVTDAPNTLYKRGASVTVEDDQHRRQTFSPNVKSLPYWSDYVEKLQVIYPGQRWQDELNSLFDGLERLATLPEREVRDLQSEVWEVFRGVNNCGYPALYCDLLNLLPDAAKELCYRHLPPALKTTVLAM